jgi:hypothetical protein
LISLRKEKQRKDMPLLKFRVMYEDDDSIYRDIEIKPAQSFEELEAVIRLSYNIPAVGEGKFLMSNDNWQRGKQIHPPAVKSEEKKSRSKAKAQSLPSIVLYIDDPHQHFIYEFHGAQELYFLVQLVTIGGTESPTLIYPVMLKSQGTSPFRKEEPIVHHKRTKGIVASDVTEENIVEEDEEEEEELSPFVESSSEPDAEELASIEGEEGDATDGDAIKEEEETDDKGDDTFVTGDDFDPEDLSDNVAEDFDEEV